MWTWTCSACGATFTRDEKAGAQAAFNEHAVKVHNAKIVLSMEGEDQ
jgi:hypothetical protein